MNNYIIEINDIKIPQNEKDYFIFKKSKDWKSAVDLHINIENDVNVANLYLIFKSFLNMPDIPLIGIALVVIKKEDNKVDKILRNERVSNFIKMGYKNFEEWIKWRFLKDWKYIESHNFYAIKFIFESKALYNKNLENLKPLYPWNTQMLEFVKDENLEILKLVKDIKKMQIRYNNLRLKLLKLRRPRSYKNNIVKRLRH